MATPTYTLIDSVTLTSTAASVTFSSITQDYRDLVLSYQGSTTSTTSIFSVVLNSDTGANYSRVWMLGRAGAATSGSGTADSSYRIGTIGTGLASIIVQIMDYSATDKHKTALVRHDSAAEDRVYAFAARWGDTSAISSILVNCESDTFTAGSTFYLYGIEA